MTPKYYKLRNKMAGVRHWSWFDWSKNRLGRLARRGLKRASRREMKRHGRQLIEEEMNARG